MEESKSLSVELSVPKTLTRGDVLVASVRILNRSAQSVSVSARLNLFEGDFRVRLQAPDGKFLNLQGTLTMDSAPNRISLKPGESFVAPVQLHYTNRGFAFSEPGTYTLIAEYHPDPRESEPAVSEPVEITVKAERDAQDEELSAMTLNPAFGRALASGDAGGDPEGISLLKQVAEAFPRTIAGQLASLVHSNTLAGEKGDLKLLKERLKSLAKSDTKAEAARLALAAAPPGYAPNAPIVKVLEQELKASAQSSDEGGELGDLKKTLETRITRNM
jgi:hypothetical protein